MTMRVLVVAASAVLLLGGCDEGSKKCKGLSEADCTAKSECSWNAEKGKCKVKKEERIAPEQSAPPAASEQTPPPEQSAPPASEQTPPAQSEPAPELPQGPPQ